jgi:hypothetical protein
MFRIGAEDFRISKREFKKASCTFRFRLAGAKPHSQLIAKISFANTFSSFEHSFNAVNLIVLLHKTIFGFVLA